MNRIDLIWSFLHLLAKPLQGSILAYSGNNGREEDAEELQLSPDSRPGLDVVLS